MDQTTSTSTQTQVAKKKIYKKWWFWVIAIIVVMAIGKMGGNNQSTSNSSGTSSNVENNSAPSAIVVSSTKLLDDYKANEVSADNKYKGKILEVSGVVDNIGKDLMDKAYVSLKTDDMIFSVQCFFENTNALASLSKGQSLTIRGECDGKMGNVLLKECSIK